MPVIFPLLASAAGTIGTSALIGAGTVGAISAAKAVKKQEEGLPSIAQTTQNQAAISPNPVAAEEAAQRSVEEKRRIMKRTGGQTILTREGYLGAGGSGLKTLLGS